MPRDDQGLPAASGDTFQTGIAEQQQPQLRRRVFAGLVAATMMVLVAAFALAMAQDGIGWLEVVLLILFTLNLPWLVVGFWNGAIGLFILVHDRGRLDRILPIPEPAADAPITARTAVVVPIHQEDPDLVFRHLRATVASLRETGAADAFDVFILSDTGDEVTLRREEELFAAWRAECGTAAPALHYRRRALNSGFKAGNIREFCDRWGDNFDLMIVLDADSVMSGPAMLRCVRLMQANADLGILQTLVVGLPTESAFARVFQFGMRHAMRAYTVGSAWWQGDCGPYWGHNAIVRLAPFIAHCRLPRITGGPPFGGDVLSHDQLEAVLMRKAGWAVRVLPIEDGSWEANPPTLPDHTGRDLRWCHGNLQYLRLRLPGLHRLGRIQILLAILMYTGSPVWLAFLFFATLGLFVGPATPVIGPIPPEIAGHLLPATTLGLVVFLAVAGMALAPKLFGLAYAFADMRQRRAFGGGGRLAAGAVVDLVFSMLLSPVMSVTHTVFILGLMAKRPLRWGAQVRTGHAVGWAEAATRLWPQTALGLVWLAALGMTAPWLVPWAGPALAGLILCVPFAVFTSRPWLGRALRRLGLGATPEERALPAELATVCPWLRAPLSHHVQSTRVLFELEHG